MRSFFFAWSMLAVTVACSSDDSSTGTTLSTGGAAGSGGAGAAGAAGGSGATGATGGSGGEAGSGQGECAGNDCGSPCTSEAGPGLCDGSGSCVVVAVDCGTCGGKACGDPCLDCEPTDTACQMIVCDALGTCDYASNVGCD